MERLTKWLNGKTALCFEPCEIECTEGYYECHKCKPFADAMKKLAQYEDAEEQKLLLMLPCKVGDSVWLLFADGCIEEHTVSSIRIGNTVDNICFENDSYYTVWDKDYKSLNKWFFTTKEEAEAALEKMKGE